MSERFTGIAFGTGPIGYQEGPDEKRIREVVEKIDQETKEAGLPWWAGLFNPKIVELAEIERKGCKCARSKTERTERGDTDGIVEETPKAKRFREIEEQHQRIFRADELVVEAICREMNVMKKLEEQFMRMEAKDEGAFKYARNIAEIGDTIACLRRSMCGMPFHGHGV